MDVSESFPIDEQILRQDNGELDIKSISWGILLGLKILIGITKFESEGGGKMAPV